MIISASRRTDIPAFFGEWFMHRIREGWFVRVNPFNPKQRKQFSLEPKDVDCIVFWSKHPQSFVRHLSELVSIGHKYYFQYTLNGYGSIFEPGLPAPEKCIDTFRELSHRIGSRKVLWRYDPIILSSITPVQYHIDRIAQIAEFLHGYTHRLTISFYDSYGKSERRFKRLQQERGVVVEDIAADSSALRELAVAIKKIGDKHNLEVVTCSEPLDLSDIGIEHGACIDAELINNLFDLGLDAFKDRSQRKECLCTKAVDVGYYNTCRFECVYCYANYSSKSIASNLKKHDVNSPTLVGSGR